MRYGMTRRSVLGGLAVGLAAPGAVLGESLPLLKVVKDPGCGCCGAWIEIMRSAGFEAKVWNATYEQLEGFKAEVGVSDEMASCHTALLGDYVIEGHVPPREVMRLLRERPEAIGLSVPGMPMGSPGMGPESEREAYDVYLIGRDGTARVYASYTAA